MEIEETLPFPPPLVRRGTPTDVRRATAARVAAARAELARVAAAPPRTGLSLEQLTEARLAELQEQRFLWETPPPRQSETPEPSSRETSQQTSRQIVLARPSAESSALVPLQWRGVPVSPEFQVYALRVARGEDLAPYRGQILADASLAFPWDAPDVRALRPRRSLRSLFVWAAFATLAAFVLPSLATNSPEASAPPPPVLRVPALHASTVPGPLVLEPAPLAPALPSVPPALQQPAVTLPPAVTRPLALPPAAAGAGAAKRAAPNVRTHVPPASAQHPAAPSPSTDASGPSPLLLEKPSF